MSVIMSISRPRSSLIDGGHLHAGHLPQSVLTKRSVARRPMGNSSSSNGTLNLASSCLAAASEAVGPRATVAWLAAGARKLLRRSRRRLG